MSIRQVVHQHAEVRTGADVSEVRVASSMQKVAVAVALLNVASFLAGTALLIGGTDIPSGVHSLLRQVARMKRRIVGTTPYGMAKTLSRRVLPALMAKDEDLAEIVTNPQMSEPQIVAWAAENEEILPTRDDLKEIVASMDLDFPNRDSNHRPVSKTKIKIVLRILKVIVALLTIAVTLFKTFSDWQDDPEMAALFADARTMATNTARSGIGGATQTAQNTAIYRQLRQIPGIGQYLPRGGVPLIPKYMTRD